MLGSSPLDFNPYILKPVKDLLFDEKIAGSIHFTPGNAYNHCDNGNKSVMHWDLILIQTPQVGGGEIYFDYIFIRSGGRFVLEELRGLNPKRLK